ncbi:hypothetical protein MC885_014347, partial [Smutsia gigantea]
MGGGETGAPLLGSRLATARRAPGVRGGVVLDALLVELWQTLQLCWSGGLLERGFGGPNMLEPLLLVEHIIGLQSVFQDQLLDGDWLSVNLKSFGCQLVTTVAFVGIQAWQLKSDKRKQGTYLSMIDLLESVDYMVRNAPYRKYKPHLPLRSNGRQ